VLGSSPILMKVARTFEPDAGIPFFAAGHRSEVTCPNAVALAIGPELTAPTGQRRAINKRRFRKRWSDITGEAAPSPRNLRQRLKPLYHQGRVGDRHREVNAWS